MEKGDQDEEKLEQHMFQDYGHGDLRQSNKVYVVSVVRALPQYIDLLLHSPLRQTYGDWPKPSAIGTDSEQGNEWDHR